jgi:ribosomal protein L37AE/L43A
MEVTMVKKHTSKHPSQHYCPKCGTTVKPVKKFTVTVWEEVRRCQEVEILAASPEEARLKAKVAYEEDPEGDFYAGAWTDECETTGRLWTGRCGPAPRDLKGERQLLGIVAEEADE